MSDYLEGPGLAYMPDDLDRRAPAVERMAAKLAWERGGQTHPLCDYDLDRAEEIVTGQKNRDAENVRLRRRVAELEAALAPSPTSRVTGSVG